MSLNIPLFSSDLLTILKVLFEDPPCKDCSKECINKITTNVCDFITKFCEDHESNFNFYELHYCSLDQRFWIMVPIGVIIIFLCFYVLGSTADGYLSPALETITLKLGISESLAGVTFLAFANGAPDVISALVASSGGEGNDGVYLAISSLLGAGLFVSCVVGAVVILSAKQPIRVYPKILIAYLRDVGFYMLGPVILAIAAAIGELSLPFSIAFLVVYAIFVIVVFISDQIDRSKVRVESPLRHVHSEQLLNSSNKLSDDLNFVEELDSTDPKFAKSNSVQLNESVCSIFEANNISSSIKENHFGENEEEYSINEIHKIQERSKFSNSVQRTKSRALWGLVKMKRFLHKSIKPEDPWSDMNFIQKLLYICIDLPLDFFRRITIPPCNDDQWDRRFAMVFPICSVIFFYIASGNIDFTGPPPASFYILLGVGFIWSITFILK